MKKTVHNFGFFFSKVLDTEINYKRYRASRIRIDIFSDFQNCFSASMIYGFFLYQPPKHFIETFTKYYFRELLSVITWISNCFIIKCWYCLKLLRKIHRKLLTLWFFFSIRPTPSLKVNQNCHSLKPLATRSFILKRIPYDPCGKLKLRLNVGSFSRKFRKIVVRHSSEGFEHASQYSIDHETKSPKKKKNKGMWLFSGRHGGAKRRVIPRDDSVWRFVTERSANSNRHILCLSIEIEWK